MNLIIIGLVVIMLSTITFASSNAQISNLIPDSIKQNILVWAQGGSSDQDFIENIQFMIENNVITIPYIETLENENQQLKKQVEEYEKQIYDNSFHGTIEKLGINVHTNKYEYGPGDNIMIFGSVTYMVSGHDVGIVISDSSGKVLAIAKIPPSLDGSYGFVANDPMFKEFGEYDVHVYYGGSAFSNTSYVYNPMS